MSSPLCTSQDLRSDPQWPLLPAGHSGSSTQMVSLPFLHSGPPPKVTPARGTLSHPTPLTVLQMQCPTTYMGTQGGFRALLLSDGAAALWGPRRNGVAWHEALG